MNATTLAKALLVLSLGLGSVALALHQDNADRRDELETLKERLKTVQWNYEVNAALKEKLHRKLIVNGELVSRRVAFHRLVSDHLPTVKHHRQAHVPHRRIAAQQRIR